jgi:hypothetical protein
VGTILKTGVTGDSDKTPHGPSDPAGGAVARTDGAPLGPAALDDREYGERGTGHEHVLGAWGSFFRGAAEYLFPGDYG